MSTVCGMTYYILTGTLTPDDLVHTLSQFYTAWQKLLPILAPLCKKQLTTSMWWQLMARSRGLIPLTSSCSTVAPRSIRHRTLNTSHMLTNHGFPHQHFIWQVWQSWSGHAPSLKLLPKFCQIYKAQTDSGCYVLILCGEQPVMDYSALMRCSLRSSVHLLI